MQHQEFLAGVATRAGFTETADARDAARAVLAVLAERLPADDRAALATALPNLLEHEAGVDEPARPTGRELVDDVGSRTGWTPERSRYALAAVVGQITASEPDLGKRVATIVPVGLADDAEARPLPPDAASEGAQGRPQPISADELDRALRRLVDWSGDTTGIERTVGLPAERIDLVLDRIHQAERDLSARVRIVERTPTSLTVRARTESLQAVTALDVDLAERVDAAVAEVGSAG